jgi:hypothetical protein
LRRNLRRATLALAITVVLLFIAREIGWLDFSLHTSVISATHTLGLNRSQMGTDEGFSYNFSLLQGEEVLYAYNNSMDGSEPMEIKALLDAPVFTGNTAMPFVKDFKMEYICNFSTVKSPNDSNLSGSISGTVNARILGFCSRRAARQRALDSAIKHIQSEVEKWGKP